MGNSLFKYASLLSIFMMSLTSYAGFTEPRPREDFEGLGNALQYVPTLAAYATTLFKQDGEGAMQLTRSTLVTAGVTGAIKYAVNNSNWGVRPNGGEYSFPSGHTSFACSGAAFLQERYGWRYGIPALAIASVAAASRVDAEKHHVRDVVAGCAIAYVVSEFFVIRPEWENIVPVLGPKFIGFRIKFDYDIPSKRRW